MRIIIFLFLFLFLAFAKSNAIGVSPSKLEFDFSSTGVSFEREFTIFNTQNIKLSYLIYTANYEDWFEFIPDKISIPSGESKKIKVIVNIPKDIHSGNYNTNIYIKQTDSETNQIILSPAVAIKTILFVGGNNNELINNNINLSSKEIKFNITKEIQNKTNENKESGNSSLFKINSNVIKQANSKNNFTEIDTKGLLVTASIFFAGILLYGFKKSEPFEL